MLRMIFYTYNYLRLIYQDDYVKLKNKMIMRKRFIFLQMLLSLLIFTVIISCTKKSENDNELSADITSSAIDNVFSSNAYDDIMTEVDDVGIGKDLKFSTGILCRERNRITGKLEWPRIIEIVFDSAGCPGRSGRIKTGTIRITIDGPVPFNLWAEGTTRTVELINFTVNGNKVEGTKTIVCQGLNEEKNPYWDVTLKNGKITFKDGNYITREFKHTRVLYSGFDSTFNTISYQLKIYGTGSGITRNGLAYTDTIVQPLIFETGCRYIKAGQMKLTVEGLDPIYITFDNEDCTGKGNIVIDFETIKKSIEIE